MDRNKAFVNVCLNVMRCFLLNKGYFHLGLLWELKFLVYLLPCSFSFYFKVKGAA